MTITKIKVRNAIIKEKGNLSNAAKRLGCVRKTVYNWIEKEPDLEYVVEEARDTALDFVENKLMEGIEAGHPTLIIFYLKTQGKGRGYVERTEHEFIDWRTKAIEAIQQGKATFEETQKQLGENLAHELFRSAGVKIIRN